MTDEEVLDLYIKKFFKVDPEDGVTRRGLKQIGLENFTTWREIITALYYHADFNEAAKALHYGIHNESGASKGMRSSLDKKKGVLGLAWNLALGKNNNKFWPAHIMQSVGVNKCTICKEMMPLDNFTLLNDNDSVEKYKSDVYENECISCHREKQLGWNAAWKKENGHIVNELSARRRALKAETYDVLSIEEQNEVREIYKESKRLNNEAGYIKYHVDHIKPLSKGGAHAPYNLQILLAEDNLRKSDKWSDEL